MLYGYIEEVEEDVESVRGILKKLEWNEEKGDTIQICDGENNFPRAWDATIIF